MRGMVIYSDLGKICYPQTVISTLKEMDKWVSVPYETKEVSGSMLISLSNSKPEEVCFDINLEGWYKIFLGICAYGEADLKEIDIKLTDDIGFYAVMPDMRIDFAEHSIQESYWKTAKLDGQKIHIAKIATNLECDASIAWVRCVPMSEDEVEAYKKEQARTDTKRIYAANDIHGMLYYYNMKDKTNWNGAICEYNESDVEWLSVETHLQYKNSGLKIDLEKLNTPREGDRLFSKNLVNYTEDIYGDLVKMGHEAGLKMCLSMRMCTWSIETPFDQMYYEDQFYENNMNLRCVDRDGSYIDYLSYAYPEVQEYIIGRFTALAKYGFDAMKPIFNRGLPFVLFEPPFVEKFEERYNEDPRLLPLDDERIISLKCEIMTDFMRKLKNSIEEASGGVTKLHARIPFSIYDAKCIGLNVEQWCREGIVTAIVSYPRRIREKLPQYVFTDESHTKIDIERYKESYTKVDEPVICDFYDFDFIPPMEDSKGILRGPASQKERIDEFMRLEREYGVTVYIDIMPRNLSCEKIKNRVQEIYDLGCSHISLWDTNWRTRRLSEWSMWRRTGHIDELSGFSDGNGELYRKVKILKIGNKDVSRYVPVWGG